MAHSIWNESGHGSSSHHFSFHNSFNSPRDFDRSRLPVYPRSNSVDSVMGDGFQTQPKRPKFEFSFSHNDRPFLHHDLAATPPDRLSNTKFQKPLSQNRQQQQRNLNGLFHIPGLGGDSPVHVAKQNSPVSFSFSPSQFERVDDVGMSHYPELHETAPETDHDFAHQTDHSLSYEAHSWHDELSPKHYHEDITQTSHSEQIFRLGKELWRDPKLEKLALKEVEMREPTRDLKGPRGQWSGNRRSNPFLQPVGTKTQGNAGSVERHQWRNVSPRQRPHQRESSNFKVSSFNADQVDDVDQVQTRYTRGNNNNLVNRSNQWVEPLTPHNMKVTDIGRVNVSETVVDHDPSSEEQRRQDEIKRIREIGMKFAQDLKRRTWLVGQIAHNKHQQPEIEKSTSITTASATNDDETRRLREENKRLRELLSKQKVVSQEPMVKSSVQTRVLQLNEVEDGRSNKDAERMRKIEIERKIQDKVKEMRERELRISQQQSGQVTGDEASESSLNVSVVHTPRTVTPVKPLPLFPHVNPSPVANSNLAKPRPLFSVDAAQVPDVSTTQPTTESPSLNPSSFSFNLDTYTSLNTTQQSMVKTKSQPRPPSTSLKPPSLMELNQPRPPSTSSKPPSLMELDITSPIKRTPLNSNVKNLSVTQQPTSSQFRRNNPPFNKQQNNKASSKQLKNTSRNTTNEPTSQTRPVRDTWVTAKRPASKSVQSQGTKMVPRRSPPLSQTSINAKVSQTSSSMSPKTVVPSSKVKVSPPSRAQTTSKECQLCKILVSNVQFWDAHVNSPRHQNLAAGNKDTSQKGVLSFSFFCSVCDSVCHSELSYLQHINSKKHGENLLNRSKATIKALNKEDLRTMLTGTSGKGQTQEMTSSSSESIRKNATPTLSPPPIRVKKRIIKLKRPWSRSATPGTSDDQEEVCSQQNTAQSNSTVSSNSPQSVSKISLVAKSNSSSPSSSRIVSNKEKHPTSTSLQRPSSSVEYKLSPKQKSPLLTALPTLTHEPMEDETTDVGELEDVPPRFICPEFRREEDIDDSVDDDELQIHPELNDFEEDLFEVGNRPNKLFCHESQTPVERKVCITGEEEHNGQHGGVSGGVVLKTTKRSVLDHKLSQNYKSVLNSKNRQSLFPYATQDQHDWLYNRSGYHGDYYQHSASTGAHSFRSFVPPSNRYQTPPTTRQYLQRPPLSQMHYYKSPYLKFGTP